jgi:hypothetical protein
MIQAPDTFQSVEEYRETFIKMVYEYLQTVILEKVAQFYTVQHYLRDDVGNASDTKVFRSQGVYYYAECALAYLYHVILIWVARRRMRRIGSSSPKTRVKAYRT